MQWSSVVAKAVLCNQDGHVLLLRRSETDEHRPGQWDFPGGRVENDEYFAAAIAREIKEEVGLDLPHHSLHLSYVENAKKPNKPPYCYLIFIAIVEHPDIQLSFEHDQYVWVTLEKAIEIHQHPRHRQILSYIRDHRLLPQPADGIQ